jgi:hypothetical protein
MAGTLICRGFPQSAPSGGRMDLIWSAEMSWQLFEATGSVWAYLAYRRLTRRVVVVARVSLN